MLKNKPSPYVIALFAIGVLFGAGDFKVRGQNIAKRNIESPAVIVAIAPSYGPLAMSARASGEVAVDVIIDRVGAVISAKAASGHKILMVHAEKAALLWKFQPASGDAGDRAVQLRFVFKLVPFGTPYNEVTPAIFSPPYRVEVRNVLPDERPLP